MKITCSLLIGCLLFLPGCLSGLIVAIHTVPLVENMKGTPVGTKSVTLERHQIREPFTGVNVRALWDSNAIGDAAKRHGLQKIYYADLYTLSIFSGLYEQKKVIVYGD